MILSLLLAAQMAPQSDDLKSGMEAVSAQEAISLFQRVCFTPFPDPKASLEVISDPELALEKLPETPSQAMQPGDAWASPRARVGYVDADWLPRDLGSPQCSVTAALAGAASHAELAENFASSLKLPAGRIGKDSGQGVSRWDMPGRDPDRWRLFLSTEQTASGTELRMIVMNLRGKREKKK